jgi:CubicO group peptidase (beta-lactamase class C family)
MDKTSWRLAGIDQSILAMPYNKSESKYIPFGQYGEPDYPDGMLRTSAKELARFLIAYIQGGRYNSRQILRSKTIQEMLKRQTPLDRTQGLVWSNEKIGRRPVWGHDGSDNGAGAQMWFDPKKQEGVILMTNGDWDEDKAIALLKNLFNEADGY